MPQEIAGRDAELELARGWLDRPGGGVLVFDGEAGIGKTTLWRRCADEATTAGARILSCAPSEPEAGLPYSALADLLEPILADVLPDLPERQRRALEAALLLGDDGSSRLDERAVAFATLSALRAAAGTGRLVVAVDDVQWLDPSSALVLAYALRRVAAEADVRVLLARRRTNAGEADAIAAAFPPDSVETVHVRPLSLGAMHRAVRVALGAALPRPTLVRVHEASGGRPLHGLELARTVAAGGEPRGEVEELLRRRVALLPPGTREALMVVAAATDTSVDTLDQVLGGSARTALEPAEEHGLVHIADGQARLGHPLLGDAVLAAADPGSVAAAHRAFAAIARTAEERAVHLARAADGPDAAIASSLDAAVRSARARGAPTTAADLAELAARVTPPEDEETRLLRLLAAADAAFAGGDVDRAKTLFASVAAAEHELRYRAHWRLGVLLDETVGPEAATEPLEQALGTDDDALASAVHRSIAQLLLYTGDVLAGSKHAAAAVEAARRSGSDEELAYSLGVLAFAQHMGGEPAWEHTIADALEREQTASLPDPDLSPSFVAADLYRTSMRLDLAREAYLRIRDDAVQQQDVRTEVWSVFGLAYVALNSGRLADAGQLAAELFDLSEQTGLMRLPAMRCLAHHAALSGDMESARRLLAELVEESESRGELLNLRASLVIEGQLALSLGNPQAAVEALHRARAIAEDQHVAHDLVVIPVCDEIEALALAGDAERTGALAASLDQVRLPWAAPLLARAAGLAAAARGDLDDAVSLLQEATRLELPLPVEQARSWLLLGRALRRAKRRGEAREALTEARRRFEALGAALWAAQATQELTRISGRAPGESGLTPTERQVAGLVAAGRSNKETAAALFLTVKTVEVTLTRVYRKLGVRGRSELAARHDELVKQ